MLTDHCFSHVSSVSFLDWNILAGRFNVDVDTNHPLAGQTLTFDIAIAIESVREATADELFHGHSHGADGHSHHD